jgi:HAD superfamily hydrolase (TIGR01549 family)
MADDSALIFDFDGTLVDSVYAHVIAWLRVLGDEGYEVPAYRIHRLIGMSGKLLPRLLVREFHGEELDTEAGAALEEAHDAAYEQLNDMVRPFDGSAELVERLQDSGTRWAIATSSTYKAAKPNLEKLGVPEDVPVVSGDIDLAAKPEPAVFVEAAARLETDPGRCFVIGDSPWDILAARRGGLLGVGVLTGGFARTELDAAGPYRVYEGPQDVLLHLEELGVR